jgi:hypothetical protein
MPRNLPKGGLPAGSGAGQGGIIGIDGKSLKGAYDKGQAHAPRMTVSAYAAELHLVRAADAARSGVRGFPAFRHSNQENHLSEEQKLQGHD